MGMENTFGTRESPPVEDIDVLDSMTAMGLYKSMVTRLDDIRDAVEEMEADSEPKLTWSYAPISGGIVDTADVTLTPAPETAGHRNYVTSIQILNTDATVGSEVVVKDGTTVIWRGYAQHSVAAVSQPGMVSIVFPGRGLRQPSVNSPLTAACITTSTQTYLNAQGYIGP